MEDKYFIKKSKYKTWIVQVIGKEQGSLLVKDVSSGNQWSVPARWFNVQYKELPINWH